MMKAVNIEWDITDDVFDYNIDDCDLPTSVEIPSYIEDIEDVADYLSDEYGFCVISFDIQEDTDIECPICGGTFIHQRDSGLMLCIECGNEFSL